MISSKPATTCNSKCWVIILLSGESVSWDSPFPTSESKQQKCKKGHIHHELSTRKYLQNIVQNIYFVKSVDKLGPKWSLNLRVSKVRKRSAFSSTLTWLLYNGNTSQIGLGIREKTFRMSQNLSERNQKIKQLNTKFWVEIRVYKQMRYVIKQDLAQCENDSIPSLFLLIYS